MLGISRPNALVRLAIYQTTCSHRKIVARNCCDVHYVQGQSPEPKIREYFYYINHEGMVSNCQCQRWKTTDQDIEPFQLFLDDARIKNFTSCFKDKHFIQFFFKRLRFNETNRYQKEFPYLSLCGRERNFIRCDDVPVVFTEIMRTPNSKNDSSYSLSYNHAAGDLLNRFQPNNIYMSPETGRVFHPAKEQYGSIGLIRSKMAIEFSKYFEFENGEKAPPTHFTWNNQRYELNNEWLSTVRLPPDRKQI